MYIFRKESLLSIQQKFGLQRQGGCIVANNNSRIPEKELNELLEIVALYYFKIVLKWKEKYGEDSIKFYC